MRRTPAAALTLAATLALTGCGGDDPKTPPLPGAGATAIATPSMATPSFATPSGAAPAAPADGSSISLTEWCTRYNADPQIAETWTAKQVASFMVLTWTEIVAVGFPAEMPDDVRAAFDSVGLKIKGFADGLRAFGDVPMNAIGADPALSERFKEFETAHRADLDPPAALKSWVDANCA